MRLSYPVGLGDITDSNILLFVIYAVDYTCGAIDKEFSFTHC